MERSGAGHLKMVTGHEFKYHHGNADFFQGFFSQNDNFVRLVEWLDKINTTRVSPQLMTLNPLVAFHWVQVSVVISDW